MTKGGHTELAVKNSTGGFWDKFKANLDTNDNYKAASAIRDYIEGETSTRSLVDSLSQNTNLSLNSIDGGLAKAGVSIEARRELTEAIRKTRQRTGTRIATKDETGKDRKFKKIFSGLGGKPSAPLIGEPPEPENIYQQIAKAITINQQRSASNIQSLIEEGDIPRISKDS